MTSPIGTPDDQVGTNAAGNPYFANVFTATVGTADAFSGPCGSFPALSVEANTTTSGITVFAIFYEDSTLAVETGLFAMNLGSHGIVRALLPILGNWMVLQTSNPTAGSASVTINATPVNVSVQSITYMSQQNYVSQGVTSVPSSTTEQYFLPYVQPGQAWFFFQPQDATGKLNVTVQADANFPAMGGPVFQQTGPTAEIDRILGLPDLPMLVTVTNTDATAAHSFRLNLTPTGGT